MAQRVTTLLLDDIDGTEAAETITFGVDGAGYEIDLNGVHAKALREALAPYVEAGRRVGGRTKPIRPHRTIEIPNANGRRPARPDPAQTGAIRTWANKNGFKIGGKGRLPLNVVQAWEAAHA
jgi:hypothetical protein